MTPFGYIIAARVPKYIEPQTFGLWQIERRSPRVVTGKEVSLPRELVGFDDYTLLRRFCTRTMHLEHQEVVMEDSIIELMRHLPIWLAARGRVLVTGLGLGCVVRALMIKPEVEHIDVVEIDGQIIDKIGPTLIDPRVRIIEGDALKVDLSGERYDYAWHDLWTDGPQHLQILHVRLYEKFRRQCGHQGAWAFPRHMSRLIDWRPLGSPKYKRREMHNGHDRKRAAAVDLQVGDRPDIAAQTPRTEEACA